MSGACNRCGKGFEKDGALAASTHWGTRHLCVQCAAPIVEDDRRHFWNFIVIAFLLACLIFSGCPRWRRGAASGDRLPAKESRP